MADDNAKNDLFGDSSSDGDTDDLIAAAKSQPIARKKEGASTKKKVQKKTPDADGDDSDFEDGNEGGSASAGLFDSSSEDEESGPKKKKLGKKRKGKAKAAADKKKPAAAKKGPPKKDTRSKKERMEALAKKRAGGDEGGGSEPRKKRSKPDKDGKGGDDKGYASGDSYDSVDIKRTKDDDDFIDAADEDPDALKELYSEQHFDDERPDEYDSEEEKKMKKQSAAARKGGGAGLDKITLSDDEGGEGASASNALKAAVRRMQRKKKEKKNLNDLQEEGTEFLKRMEEAADVDYTSIAKKRPAVKRLAMLQEVMDMLARKDMVRVLLELDLLSVCKRWIQPLPNGTLGNVTLRRRILEAICSMTGENGVTSSDLKNSGFGKVVMTLYMHKNETPEMKKMLKGAIEQWSRPIFQKSGNMRDLERAQAARGMAETGSLVGIARAQRFESKQEERRRSGEGRGSGTNADVRRGKTADDLEHIITKGSKAAIEIGNNRVRVPYSKGFQYSVRPENRKGNVSDKRNLVSAKAAAAVGGGGMASEKRDALSKRMIEKNRKTNKQTQRSANISIEGRAVK